MAPPTTLSTTQLLAAATGLLTEGGYAQVATASNWPSTSRLFEDPYGIVALHVYDTWRQLRDHWNVAQGLLVDEISAHLTRPEPKLWEGYLVLLTGGPTLDDERREVDQLRYDTNRLRKLVATGYELETLNDVRNALLPLLPLDVDSSLLTGSGLLDRLPELLAEHRIDPSVTATVVAAFLGNESMVEKLHQLREAQ